MEIKLEECRIMNYNFDIKDKNESVTFIAGNGSNLTLNVNFFVDETPNPVLQLLTKMYQEITKDSKRKDNTDELYDIVLTMKKSNNDNKN